MGETNSLMVFLNCWKQEIKCFFGKHDFDVYELLYFDWEDQTNPGRFYASCCSWCRLMKYGAAESDHGKGE